MKRSYLLIFLSSLFFGCQIRAFAQQSSSPILAPGATVTEIFSAGEDFLEGIAMSPDGLLYFSDFPNGGGKPSFAGIIWTLNPQTKAYKIFRSPSGMSNGLKFDAAANLIACEGGNYGGRRITKTDGKTGKSIIYAGLYGGHQFNSPNDLVISAAGQVYFSDPRYLGPEPIEQNGMNVYRIDTAGTVHLAAADVAKPNGLVLSPDQTTLYVADCDYPGNGRYGFSFEETTVKPRGNGAVLAYEVTPDGSLKFRSKLIDYGSAGGPDGMTVDAEGNLYVALGNRVGVYSAGGKLITEIKCPRATNLCFGRGAFSKSLFIAGGKSVYRIDTLKEGFQLPGKSK